MKNERVENCWEFWNCSLKVRDKCFAYKFKMGDFCWLISTDATPLKKRKFANCWECNWYKNFTEQVF